MIVELYHDRAIGRMIKEVLNVEGYDVNATHDPEVAWHALVEHDESYILIMDTFHIAPKPTAMLSKLAGAPSVRERVRIIGLIANLEYSRDAVEKGIVDVTIAVPFTAAQFLATLQAEIDQLAAES